ncbi:MAG: type II secretion system protein [Sulfuriflexus sp.]|nr:type II secretion system protein [Sulfuriflexus sp.]
MTSFKSQAAFSLVEFIIVIVITGVLASSIASFITLPVQGFIDLSRRATLVYSAESALRRMQRDIRRALPNSIRVNATGTAIEMINTIEGARYRAAPPGAPDTRLEFNTSDTKFDILGNFSDETLALPSADIKHIAVYNIGSTDAAGAAIAGSNAYAGVASGTNVITPAGYTITIADSGNEDNVTIDDGTGGGFEFSYASPNSRMYLIDTAISYVCSGGELRRHRGYTFTNKPTQVVPPADGTSALMANNIANCSFNYDTGNPSRSGLMTLDLTVTATTPSGTTESVRLLHQVHVDNVP